jgi:hypothetical protein
MYSTTEGHPTLRKASQRANIRISFSNDVCTALGPHPHLVDTASLDVDSIAHGICFLLSIFVLGISNRELSFQDQMRGQACVGVGRIVGVPVAKVSALCLGSGAMFLGRQTYGPSVQVNTCGNPHERTSCSDSRCDFVVIVDGVVQKVVKCCKRVVELKLELSLYKGARKNVGPCLSWRGSSESDERNKIPL